jgi:hypothetical protein
MVSPESSKSICLDHFNWCNIDSKVFCLQAHGIIDAEVDDLQSSELIAHTMANTATNT